MKNISRKQISVMNIQYKYFPLSLFLDDAVRFGVENVELWGAAPHFHMEDMTYQEIRKVRREIEGRGLKLVCFTPEQCVYPVNLASDNPDTRKRSLKFFENSIRAAGELGSDKVLVTSGTGYFDGSNRDEAWKWAEEGLYSLAEMAEDYEIVLALEILRRDESNLVYDLPGLMKMLRQLDHPSIGGMIDTIPMALASERPAQYLEALGDSLVHIHFIDGAPRGHLAWGDGVLDMEGYLEELDAYPYRGYLSLEITDGRYYMDPTKSVEQSVKRLFSVL
ncbi:MAG TPA: sugar phosphate isomerase/epimerase [Candidatus Enterocloster faecavium]|uniref:Sugar phosphate isomerase/epimerase n=1 Tax=Candidatus Enterocloster faecavium TaxID=2838560 RepID=A0A9D2L8T8_9FIRM|nr:sugar phosphate isomerase/epimerase [Candidatus Enterocloster faecavium]